MARGRRRRVERRSIRTDLERDISTLSLERSASAPGPSLDTTLSDLEDGRVWHPDPDRGAISLGNQSIARVVVDNRSIRFGNNLANWTVHRRPWIAYSQPIWSWRGLPRNLQVPVGVRFESPLKVVTCVRRKVRREVIHALDKVRNKKREKGRGGARRRTWRSNIWC